MRSGLVVLVAACGRIGFGDGTDGASGADATSAIGCADGTREAFQDPATFPTIAGCEATWSGTLDLRLFPTGAACGNGIGACAVPADACSPGWHTCTRSGDVSELVAIGPDACHNSAQSRFAAASSHVLSISPCTYASAGAWDCSAVASGGHEPICCGASCNFPANCYDGLWPMMTYQTVSSGTGCGALSAADVDGVLCCKDP